MATLDLTIGDGAAIAASPGMNQGPFKLERTVDIAVEGSFNAADILQLIEIPAKTLVLYVLLEVLTVEGSACTGDVGDTAVDPNGFFDAIDFNTVAANFMVLLLTEGTPNVVTAYSHGKYFETADTIDLVLDADMDAGKWRLVAVCLDLS